MGSGERFIDQNPLALVGDGGEEIAASFGVRAAILRHGGLQGTVWWCAERTLRVTLFP